MGIASPEVSLQRWDSSREAGPLAQDMQRRNDGEPRRNVSADQGPLEEHAGRERSPAVHASADSHDAGYPARVQYPVIGVHYMLYSRQGAA